RDYLRRRVDCRDSRDARRQVPREQARSARKLEHLRRPRTRQHFGNRGLDNADLRAPRRIVVGAAIEAARAKPPRVVLGRTRPVIRDLIVEERSIVCRAGHPCPRGVRENVKLLSAPKIRYRERSYCAWIGEHITTPSYDQPWLNMNASALRLVTKR